MSAVSAVMARRSRQSSFTCFRGRPEHSANSVWVRPKGSRNSSTSSVPTDTGFFFVNNIAPPLPVGMIVEIDIARFAAIPSEDQSPLGVHPNAMPPLKGTGQALKTIAWRNPKIGVTGCIIDHLQLAKDPIPKIGRQLFCINVLQEKIPKPRIPPALDHRRQCTIARDNGYRSWACSAATAAPITRLSCSSSTTSMEYPWIGLIFTIWCR